MNAPNWKKIFLQRRDLEPPGQLQCVVDSIIDNLWEGWKLELLDLEEKRTKKNKSKKSDSEPKAFINYGKGQFPIGSIVTLLDSRNRWRGKYIVKSDVDLGRQLIKIQNLETKSIQWVSEKRVRRI